MPELSPTPPDVLASQYQLGVLCGTYSDHKVSTSITSLIFSILFFATVVYLLSRGLLFSWFSLIPLFLAFIVLFRFISSARRVYRQRGTSLSVYEHGLMRLQYQDRELMYSDAIRWEDIAIVWDEIHEQSRDEGGTTRVHLYRLQRKDGTFFGGATGYKIGFGKVIIEIKQKTLRYLWPETFERYQRGLPISFGPLTITQSGIQYQSRSILWAEIAIIDCNGISSKDFILNMRREQAKAHGWPIQIRFPLAEVPNVPVLRRLLVIAREQQAPPHFDLFGVFPKEVAEVMAQSYSR